MKTAANRRASCPGCASLEQRVAACEARLAGLEGTREVHDEDRAALLAVAAAADGRPFTVGALWWRARVDPALLTALRSARVQSAGDLRRWCGRLRRTTLGRLRLVRLKRQAEGYMWLVRDVENVARLHSVP